MEGGLAGGLLRFEPGTLLVVATDGFTEGVADTPAEPPPPPESAETASAILLARLRARHRRGSDDASVLVLAARDVRDQ